ncbi:putative exportin-4-like [Apostichopus japonicus]|uniref:Putative exportin-4-like n=1 Tax=Stichopus japonicus TaxID=307972 RepID=A0A2G8JDF3_STIJA|nr:putative exportin-4-like [Apostichopus japonicus]
MIMCPGVCGRKMFRTKTLSESQSNFESVDSPALKPDRSWKGILLDKQVIELFFKIHIRVRHRHDLCHHVILCLSQLATLRGNIFTGNPAQVEYLHHFIQCVLHTLNSGEIQDHEALGLSGIFNNLINTHPTGIFVSLPGDVLTSFVTNLTNLTCHFCSKASLEEASSTWGGGGEVGEFTDIQTIAPFHPPIYDTIMCSKPSQGSSSDCIKYPD